MTAGTAMPVLRRLLFVATAVFASATATVAAEIEELPLEGIQRALGLS